MNRRAFLLQSGAALALTCARPGRLVAAAKFRQNPFTLGVASGDPLPDGIVLWTRLAPDPFEGGGMSLDDIQVEWRLAEDEKFTRGVKKGKSAAPANLGHSVHVDVRGLQPGRDYWYQFKAGNEWSPIGQTRTAPSPGALELRFAFASCQHFETGLFTAYQHMLRDDLDLVVHLGDYIYEGPARPNLVRQHRGNEINSLSDYRNRYALYRSDPHLRAAHARFPWIVTWDDHELDNNYAGDKEEHGAPRDAFLERRANAYQAYYEHMPLRRSSMPKGTRLDLYRRLSFGDLADFHVLDTRQYRTDQPCGDGNKPQCPEALSPDATLLGEEQQRWLFEGLDRSHARWNILAQQVMMARVDRRAGPEEAFAMDQWSGYEAARRKIQEFLANRKPSNPVVITGDIHSNWVADIKADWTNPRSATLATEFVGTSISSGGDGTDTQPAVQAYLPENPHVKFYNSQRGYVRCSVTRDRWQSDYQVLDFVTKPGSEIRTRASFVVEHGRPGAEKA